MTCEPNLVCGLFCKTSDLRRVFTFLMSHETKNKSKVKQNKNKEEYAADTVIALKA